MSVLKFAPLYIFSKYHKKQKALPIFNGIILYSEIKQCNYF